MLFLVYITWGSTFIGYKLTLEVVGPFFAAGGRSLGGGVSNESSGDPQNER